MPQQTGACLAAEFDLGQQCRPEPLGLGKTAVGLDRLSFCLQARGTLLQTLHLLVSEAMLDLAGIDPLPAVALSEIDAIELPPLVSEASDHEGVAMATG